MYLPVESHSEEVLDTVESLSEVSWTILRNHNREVTMQHHTQRISGTLWSHTQRYHGHFITLRMSWTLETYAGEPLTLMNHTQRRHCGITFRGVIESAESHSEVSTFEITFRGGHGPCGVTLRGIMDTNKYSHGHTRIILRSVIDTAKSQSCC